MNDDRTHAAALQFLAETTDKRQVAILFLIIGLAFVGVGVFLAQVQRSAFRDGTPLKGEVVGYIDGKDFGEGSALFPIIKAKWEGEDRYLRSPVGSLHPLFPPRSTVSLSVIKGSPTRVALQTRALYYGSAGFIGLGLIAIVVFFVSFRWDWFDLLLAAVVLGSFWRRSRKAQLKGPTFQQWLEKTRGGILPSWLSEEAVSKINYLPLSLVQLKINRHQRAARVWGLVFIFLGGTGLYFSEGWLGKRHHFIQIAQRTEGKVSDLHFDDSDSGVMYPIVSFRDPASGDEVQFKHSVGSNPPSYRMGDKVEVLFDPGQPKKAMISSGVGGDYLGPALAMLGSLAITLLGVASLYKKTL